MVRCRTIPNARARRSRLTTNSWCGSCRRSRNSPGATNFTIGDRVQNTPLDVLEALIEATYARDRLQHLQQANLGIEKLRFLLRTATDLKLLDRRPLVVQVISGAGGSGKKMQLRRLSARGHVWTAPWQGLSDAFAALVGCGHVSGLLLRHVWPLALMLCADRVPILFMHLVVR